MSEDFLINFIKEHFNALDLTEITSILSKSPSEWQPGVWNVMMQIFNAILPIAYSLLTLMVILELIDKMTRVDIRLDLEVLFKVVILILIAKMVISNCFNFLNLIIEVTNDIVSSANVSVKNSAAASIDVAAKITEHIKDSDMGYLDRLGFFIQFMPAALFYKIISIVISVIVYGRFIQLYVMTALAPLPIAAIGHEKTRHISMRFFQEYIGVCLQGLVILISLQIQASMIVNLNVDSTMDLVWGSLKISIIVLMCIVGSGALAKRIVGAS